MCVIIHQPKGAYLTKEEAQRAWTRNPDGGGFAFINDDNAIQFYKSMDFDEFWRTFERSRSDYPKRDFLVHMRIATHGTVDIENTHPFLVGTYTVMAHNGILYDVPEYNDGRSDTRVFIDEVIPELPGNWLDSYYLRTMVSEFIGDSKLMFLTNDPALKENVYIINKRQGEEVDGMWMSNVYHRPKSRQYAPASHYSWYDDYGYSKWDDDDKDDTKATEILVDVTKPSEDWAWDDATDIKFLERRRESGYTKELIYMSKAGSQPAFYCMGCDEMVDKESGECRCYNKLCVECENFAGMCECSGGYSQNLVEWEDALNWLQTQAIMNDQGMLASLEDLASDLGDEFDLDEVVQANLIADVMKELNAADYDIDLEAQEAVKGVPF